MSANTLYYAKVPVIKYEWVEISAVCEDEVRERYPNAVEIQHYTEREAELSTGEDQ